MVIMKAEKILWNKLNFILLPSWSHLEVGGKRAPVITCLPVKHSPDRNGPAP